MSIKQHLQTTLQNIVSEKDRAISAEREKVIREQVATKIADIEQAKNEAINALNSKLNQDIANLQQNFGEERAKIIEACEKKKTEYTEHTVATATAYIAVEYDKAIANLEKQISEIKD